MCNQGNVAASSETGAETLRCEKQDAKRARLHIPLVEGPRHDEDDIVDHVAVGAVVQELPQVRVRLRGEAGAAGGAVRCPERPGSQ